MKNILKKALCIGGIVAMLAGCTSYEQHKGDYRSLGVCKSKQTDQYRPTDNGGCPRSYIKEMYFDLDDNPETVEQWVQLDILDKGLISNLITPGFKPAWTLGRKKLQEMIPEEQESINKQYQELKKWYWVH